ncbi:MAG: hypothetical protein KAI66_24945 [Lentisphaeria bacterium]|nr:hypothetical protein [Lentisphaeria bacterium]
MKKRTFNMIEVVLAIGVVVVGMVSIMALFPIGANQLRDAAVDNYGSQAAEGMLNVFASHVRSSTANWTAFIGDSGTGNIVKSPAGGFNDADRDNFDEASATVLIFDPSIFRDGDYTHFKILRYRDVDNSDSFTAGDTVEFSAIALLWKKPIRLGDPDPAATGNITIPYDTGVVLNLEMSWPAELPYGARQKCYYRREVFNPN